MKLGLAMNVVAFNIYIVPELEFVAQLLHVPDLVSNMMSWTMELRRSLKISANLWFEGRSSSDGSSCTSSRSSRSSSGIR